jgi:hypothetical protein
MSKILIIIKYITITINLFFISFFVFYNKSFAFDFASTINFIFFTVSTLTLFIIETKSIIKRQLIEDYKYNIAFIISQLVILFIILRNLFDPNLFLNFDNLQLFTNEPSNMNSFFLINNYFYINILNICLLSIWFINKKIKD